MAASNINRVVLTGNLTFDPELRALQSGTSVCKLRIASNTRRKDNSTGEWVDKPNYFDVTIWGRQGENAAQYLTKGRPVAIDGRLEWREWQDQQGNNRQSVEIVADSVQFLGGRGITISRNLVGSYITSLEMAGCSITLLRLDVVAAITVGPGGQPGNVGTNADPTRSGVRRQSQCMGEQRVSATPETARRMGITRVALSRIEHDENEPRLSTLRALARQGVVATAGSVAEALQHLRDVPTIDLVLSDMVMPGS